MPSVTERLKGCPSGATYHALRLFHTDQEIAAARASGQVRTEIRDYANPRNFKVEWFYHEESK